MLHTCELCGAVVQGKGKFCGECGRPLDGDEEQPDRRQWTWDEQQGVA